MNLLCVLNNCKHNCKNSQKTFVCHLCSKQFTRHHSLHRHQLDVHTNVKKHSCPICNKKFKRKQYVLTHCQNIHKQMFQKPNNNQKCTPCNEHFSKKKHLKQHIKTKHKKKLSEPQTLPENLDTIINKQHVNSYDIDIVIQDLMNCYDQTKPINENISEFNLNLL